MELLVDSNVILDIVTKDPKWFQWSSAALTYYADHHKLVINPIIYAEVSVGFKKIEDVDGVLPVENTTAGSINEVYDLLSRASLSIVGEEVFRVDHCLLAIEDVPVSKIRRILSHPQALAQCMKFLSSLENCQREYFADTAMAVRKVKEDQDLSQAAIASEEAGKRYGLKVIQRNLADQIENYTRFLVAARQPINVDERIPAKTSLILAVPHEEGALLRALNVIHHHKINLTKLESRPKLGSPFEYLFYLDFEGNAASSGTRAALDELKGATTFLKVLGTYPSEARSKTPPAIQALVGSQGQGLGEAPAEGAVEEPLAPVEDSAYKLASRGRKPEGTVITVRGVKIGGPDFIVIAGPCSVESREQILACARQVKECGGGMLRGSCFRARTSPQGFQGLGYKGLAYLAEAGREYDLPVVTEVISPADVEPVAALADVLLVGSRNMQNYSLLRELGGISKPIMLKRGMMSTLEELLSSAEYIMGHGNQQVILCERGIRTFEMVTRNTLDLGAIPILKRLTHLPLLVDPAHAAGHRELVTPLALAAHAVGPHGLMVEIHPEPEKALSEGAHALHFGEFAGLMRQIYS